MGFDRDVPSDGNAAWIACGEKDVAAKPRAAVPGLRIAAITIGPNVEHVAKAKAAAAIGVAMRLYPDLARVADPAGPAATDAFDRESAFAVGGEIGSAGDAERTAARCDHIDDSPEPVAAVGSKHIVAAAHSGGIGIKRSAKRQVAVGGCLDDYGSPRSVAGSEAGRIAEPADSDRAEVGVAGYAERTAAPS